MKYKLCLFAYSFSHKKTFDILNLCLRKGFLNLIVIASPYKRLKIKSSWIPAENRINKTWKKAKEICLKNNINYYELYHDDFAKIRKIIKSHKINIGIISGARILNKKIINIFKYGILNLHPGKIPETSGLDSFYWMIKKEIYPYVTAHFVDKYVDRGKIIMEEKIPVLKKDNFFSLKKRIYNKELSTFRKILHLIKDGKKIKCFPVKNYSKNNQLSTFEKKSIYKIFNVWKNKLIK